MCLYTQGSTSCPDNPVTNHTLVLIESSMSDIMEMITLVETNDGVFLLEERYVKENTLYFYHVLVIHNTGTAQSIPVQIGMHKPWMYLMTISVLISPIHAVTTDVQGVNFTRVEENIYFIQCSYLSGSDVSGCVYVLLSGEEGVENVTGFIERDTNGVTLEVANIGCYSEVLAYYNSTGSLPVSTNISNEITCPTASGE